MRYLLFMAVLAGCADAPQDTNLGPIIPLTNEDLLANSVATTGSTDKKSAEIVPPVLKTEGPWPRVEVPETTYGFGRMQVGTKLSHEFVIINSGDAEMNLVAGKSTCKCTVFRLNKTKLAPGEQTTLSIEWLGKFRDANFRHGGPVFTDDPEQPKIHFAVTGEVDAPFEILPEGTWQVDDVTSTEPGKTQGIICSRLFSHFEITDVIHDCEYITTEIVPMDKSELQEVNAECGYKVNVEVSSDLPPGRLEESIEFKLSRGSNVKMLIDVAAMREGPIKVIDTTGAIWISSRSGLKLGQFPAGEGHAAEMILAVQKEGLQDELRIESLSVTPPYLKVQLEPFPGKSDTVSRYRLKVEVPAGIPPTRRNSSNPATIELQTNHSVGRTFRFQASFNAF